MLLETLKLALQAILRNALRSFLTLLGVVIGVGAVIAMVTIGQGATAKVEADLSKLGSNLLFVRPGQFGPGRSSAEARPFFAKDIEALRAQLRGVRAVAPVAQSSSTLVSGSESRTVTAIGSDNDYLITQDWALAAGRRFHEGEIRGGKGVCLIGATVRREMFGDQPALGGRVRLGKMSCDIVGVLEAKGEAGFGLDQDDTILMPIRAFQRRIQGSNQIGRIMISAADGASTAKVQADIERLLRERRKIGPDQEDDFAVADMKQIAQAQTATTSVLTVLLGAVAGVSLLVGGIGIMNIMLVSVTERTREIGIRLAIGAEESQVLTQFLVEAVALSAIGGAAGVLLGLGLAWAVASAIGLPLIIDATIIVVSFGFSALIGVVFGYFPARQAAMLNPIEALRRE